MKRIGKVLLLVALLAVGFAVKVKAEERPIHEVHAMMIFNFIKYVEWPEASQNNIFTIGVFGDQDLYKNLQNFYANRSVKGQKVRVEFYSNINELGTAHVIYLADDNNKDFEAVKGKLAGKPSLLITDGRKLGKEGSCINFVENSGKLQFEINKNSFEQNHLKVSSQLLSMGILL